MSKPILDVQLVTIEGLRARAQAVIDPGSYYTIVREDILPKRAAVPRYPSVRKLGMAGRGGKLQVVGTVDLEITLVGRRIQVLALVAPDLQKEMIIGAGTMQAWDISIVSRNGTTKVVVGLDMRDPDVNEVLSTASAPHDLRQRR